MQAALSLVELLHGWPYTTGRPLWPRCAGWAFTTGQPLLKADFLSAHRCVYSWTQLHPQMARLRPLYTNWSRGQKTASRMFTSVTTATSITLNSLIIIIFLAINYLLLSSIIGNQRVVGNSTSCRRKWFVYTFVIVITSKIRNSDLILHIIYIEAHHESWKENGKMLDRHCLHYLNTTVGEEFKGQRWVNSIVVLLKGPIITKR